MDGEGMAAVEGALEEDLVALEGAAAAGLIGQDTVE